jgi:NAD(P)-dependent dehydrogenase (short-subunit alcohol dehydrogenase family)
VSKGAVLISGAAGGIGTATADCFLASGYEVAGVDLSPAVETLRCGNSRGKVADVTEPERLAAAVEELLEGRPGAPACRRVGGAGGPGGAGTDRSRVLDRRGWLLAVGVAQPHRAVHPDPGTPLLEEEVRRAGDPAVLDRKSNEIPMGRIATPDDVAAVIESLADRMTYVTDEVIRVDGGQLLAQPVDPGPSRLRRWLHNRPFR